MAEFDSISDYVKSGPRRLRDAEELLEAPTLNPKEQGADTRHLRGAVYLAGYGVECLLKAYIISRHPNCVRLSEARDEIRKTKQIRDVCSAAGHDLGYLLALTDLEIRLDEAKRRRMGICCKWSSIGRYDPRPVTREDAATRVEAARSIVNWIYTQV